MVFVAIPEPEGDCQGASVVVGESRYAGFDIGWTGREPVSRNCTAEGEHPGMVVKTLVPEEAETAAAGQMVVG